MADIVRPIQLRLTNYLHFLLEYVYSVLLRELTATMQVLGAVVLLVHSLLKGLSGRLIRSLGQKVLLQIFQLQRVVLQEALVME